MAAFIKEQQKLYIYEVRGFIRDCRSIRIKGYLGNWPEPPYNYLFFLEPVDSELQSWLSEQEDLELTNNLSIDYKDWQQVVKKKHKVGRFLVVPGISTEMKKGKLSENQKDTVLYISPCLVFGSGLHPTTSGCLAAIDFLYSQDTPRTATDVGTGTGILAIACAKCGTKKVVAFDTNPLAVQCAKDNVERNGLEGTVEVKLADGIENLTSSELLCFNLDERSFHRLLEKGDLVQFKWCIISGLLESHFDKLSYLLPRESNICWKQGNKGWITLCLKGKNSLNEMTR